MSTTDAAAQPFRLPVQWVNRPNLDFRGFAGTIASGRDPPRRRDRRRAVRRASRGSRAIVTDDGDVDAAEAGDAVTLTLGRRDRHRARRHAGRAATHRPEVADQFAAHLIWMSEEPLLPGRSYLMRIGTRSVPATVSRR